MEATDKREFAMALGALGIATGKEVDEALIGVYWQFLRDLPLDGFKHAVGEAGKRLKWFAKPSELRELAEGPTRITAAMQWAHVRHIMDKLDAYGSPDFGAVANAVIHALGGWKVLCEKTIVELGWYQKDFERLYAEYDAKDLSQIRTEGHMGAFGKPPTWCALEGIPRPPKQIESAEKHGVNGVVRELADEKSREDRP